MRLDELDQAGVVIAGMERNHAKGKWKGGKHPFGYQVDKTTHTLITDEHDAVIVRLTFDLCTKDRLGSAPSPKCSTNGATIGLKIWEQA